jgi:hypothetical protein
MTERLPRLLWALVVTVALLLATSPAGLEAMSAPANVHLHTR